MALTDAEKTDARRFMGYPAYGPGESGFVGYRFFQAYGLMEYRINNLASTEEDVIRNTYLANLSTLETAIVGASAKLGTDVAAVWTRNKNEVKDREDLFDGWRRRMCGFLGIPPGPQLGQNGVSICI